jgi:Mn-dependent DtxR family transcriptional regulator
MTRKDVETIFGVKQSRAAEIVARLVREGILVAVRRGKKTEYKAGKG